MCGCSKAWLQKRKPAPGVPGPRATVQSTDLTPVPAVVHAERVGEAGNAGTGEVLTRVRMSLG